MYNHALLQVCYWFTITSITGEAKRGTAALVYYSYLLYIHFSCCFCKICNFTYSTDASVTLKRVSMWPRARNHHECVALPQCFGSYLAQLSCFNFLTQRRAECHCRTASLEHAKCLNQQSGTEERVRNDFWLMKVYG